MIPTRQCEDLDAEIASLLNDGYRLDMITPADAPRVALLSRGNDQIRLVAHANPQSEIRNPQSTGRAGMEYRDLIPGRVGGLLVASHIRLTKGGEVPDYVHYHKLLFQVIYCKTGWVRVVYEDQGPPFVMNAGDCILQPPGIRHRVLESSAGAEVIEVSSPATHETWVDHDMRLPTGHADPSKTYREQRFVRHLAKDAEWLNESAIQYRDTGIRSATNGRADVRILRALDNTPLEFPRDHTTFAFVLDGEVASDGARWKADDGFIVSPDNNRGTKLVASPGAELLQVTLSPELVHFFFAISVPTDVDP